MATQKGRNWSSGDIVTAANLSSIEQGVSTLAEDYTPTTWANGNIVTAAGLNNIEQGIVNAGSSSSDFSTATVTVINNGAQQMGIGVAYRQTAPSEAPFQGDYLITDAYADPNESVTVEAILIDGRAIAHLLQGDIDTQVTVEGNAQVVFGNVTLITGDCTITISDSSTKK